MILFAVSLVRSNQAVIVPSISIVNSSLNKKFCIAFSRLMPGR
jgi:hypothetical protein